MSSEIQALFFGLALACLLVATFGREWEMKVGKHKVRLMPLGYVFFVIPFFWQAFQSAI